MRLRWLPLFLCSCLVSCDKVKEAVAKTKAKVSGVSAGQDAAPGMGPSPGGEVDQALAGLVDANGDGVLLRKDLPFPAKLAVRHCSRMKGNDMRVVRRSALGAETGARSGTIEIDRVWDRNGDQLSLKIEKNGFVPLAKPEDGKTPAPAKGEEPSSEDRIVGLSASFHLTGTKWKAAKTKGDFRQAAWIQGIEGSIGTLAVEGGALPRTHWFGKRRFKEGDAVTLSGDGLNVLFPGASSGKVDFVYEGRDVIDGHPCGRFSVRGDCSTQDAVGADGVKGRSDLSITSGKVWLSLLHPVVLREEMEAVISTTGDGGGTAMRFQGAVSLLTTREWKPGA